MDKVKGLCLEIDKEDTSPFFKSVCFSKLQIFDELFCTNLLSPVWSHHIGVLPREICQGIESGEKGVGEENKMPYPLPKGGWEAHWPHS